VPYTVKRVAQGCFVDGGSCGVTAPCEGACEKTGLFGHLLGKMAGRVKAGAATYGAAGRGKVFVEGMACTRTVTTNVTRNVTETVMKRVPVTTKKRIAEVVHKQVPTTVTRMVPTTVCRQVPECVTRMVPTTCVRKVCQQVTEMVPTTVCRKVPVSVTKQVPCTTTVKVPCTTTEMVPVCVTRRVAVQVPVQVVVRNAQSVSCGGCDPCATASNCGPLGLGLGSRLSGLGSRFNTAMSGGSANAGCAPAGACDPCAAGLASVACDTSRPKPIRDLIAKIFSGRLCADPCAPVVSAPACGCN